MTLFIDASAFVAVIADEADSDQIIGRIAGDPILLWSSMTCWETVTALCRSYRMPVRQARANVEDAASRFELQLVPIGEVERKAALDAYERFGKRSGSRASLNMGDCFAYACAKANDADLLYKGDDFALTDLA